MRKPLVLLGLLLILQQAMAQEERQVFASLFGDELSIKGIATIGLPVKSNIIPFQLNGGLIYFKAKLNGVSDTFVLDTGSPGLLLNEMADMKNENIFSAVGVNGGLNFQRKSGHTFEIGESLLFDVSSLSVNLSHLEKVKKQKFRGMVGHRLLERNELFLDYQNGIMRLLEGGGNEDIKGIVRSSSSPIKFQQHFAVLKVKIGKRTFHFGLDTGAEVNIIDKRIAKWLPSKLFEKTETIKIRGVSEKGVGADVGKISTCLIADKEIKGMSFVVMDMTVLNEGKSVQLDGLLGYPFLSSGLFSIDYVEGVFYSWKKEEGVLGVK